MTAIEITNLTKSYRLYQSPKDRLRELVSLKGKQYHHEFHALKDVSFSVEKGDTVGIIGQNGSGKSTLLKIICGVVRPTSGSVRVNGRISSLLELGAGFHPDFTGRDNVYMNGALMGFSREEMATRLPEIEAFADIGEFIDQPVKTYSSGMFVRLAFSAAIHVDTDVLVVDEALSVGDMLFHSKCVEKLKVMIKGGLTLLLVSHDLATIMAVCNRCVLLEHGVLRGHGPAGDIVDSYMVSSVGTQQPKTVVRANWELERNSEFQKQASFHRVQNGKASFVRIQLLNRVGHDTRAVDFEEEVTLRMVLKVHEDLPGLLQGYLIKSKDGIGVVYSDSNIENVNLRSVMKGEEWITDWHFRVALAEGIYNIACSASLPIDDGKVEHCDYITLALQFEVRRNYEAPLFGPVHWENRVEVYRNRAM